MGIRPRQSLLNPDLQRPSALNSVPRSSSMLWLDKNENLDPAMLTISAEILASSPPIALATYPEAGDLYRKLSTWIGVDPEALLLTPGSDGAIRLTFEAFIEKGDFVLHTNPTFAMYPIYCQMFGASAIAIEYSMVNGEPSLQVHEILESIRQLQPKLVCLPNPDSPTGTVISPEDLRKILSVCEELECVLLVDEAYHPFYEWSVVPWTKTSKNLIVARTFAKAWGVAGLRIGYAVGHLETISLLHKMRPMYEVSTIAVEFMTRMLDRVPEMENSVSRIQAGKLHFQNEMRELGYKVLDTNGNFAHIAFGEDLPVINAALAGHVLYRGAFAHPSLSGYSRFSVAPLEAMSRVIKLINQAITENGN
jgi:histidinol-phosphate aminotransferase